MREHPLRRRYGLELGLGLAVAGAAAWLIVGHETRAPAAPGPTPATSPAGPRAEALVPAAAPEGPRAAAQDSAAAAPADPGPLLRVAVRDEHGAAVADVTLELESLGLENGVLWRETIGRQPSALDGAVVFRLDPEPFRSDPTGHVLTLREPFFPPVTRELDTLPTEPLAFPLPPHGALEVRVLHAGVAPSEPLRVTVLDRRIRDGAEARATLRASESEPWPTRATRAGVAHFPRVGLGFEGWLVVSPLAGGAPLMAEPVRGPTRAGEQVSVVLELTAPASPAVEGPR